MTVQRYQCKYCGRVISKVYGILLKTKCSKNKTHVWVKIR